MTEALTQKLTQKLKIKIPSVTHNYIVGPDHEIELCKLLAVGLMETVDLQATESWKHSGTGAPPGMLDVYHGRDRTWRAVWYTVPKIEILVLNVTDKDEKCTNVNLRDGIELAKSTDNDPGNWVGHSDQVQAKNK